MKGNEFSLPCLTCITLAICKGTISEIQKYYNHHHDHRISVEVLICNTLMNKCSTIKNYMNLKLRRYRYKDTSQDKVSYIIEEGEINDNRIKSLLRDLTQKYK